MATDIGKFHFRLVLLGSNGTGKTSILNRFLFKKYETKYKPTVEDLFSQNFDLGCLELKVDFLDTSGEMQFPAMRRLSITTGDAFLIVYALDDESSYEVLQRCVAEIQEARPDFQEIPIVFAGNKCDTPKEQRKVPKELVSNYVHYELPRLRAKVIECSCKENINIENIFKAYLSLARVTLSSAVTLNLHSPANASNTSSTTTSGSGKRRNQSANNNRVDRSDSLRAHAPRPSSGGGGGSSNSSHHESPVSSAEAHKSSRSASIKLALGVRKSCDASIVSSMRNVFISSTRNSRDALESMQESATPTTGGSDTTKEVAQQHQVALRECINKHQQQQQLLASSRGHGRLEVDAKPRSRSLIWRPHRKSSRTSSESPDCRVT